MTQWDFDAVKRDTTDQMFLKRLSELGKRGWELVSVVEQELWGSYNHSKEAPVVTGHTTVAYLKRKREMRVLDGIPKHRLETLTEQELSDLITRKISSRHFQD